VTMPVEQSLIALCLSIRHLPSLRIPHRHGLDSPADKVGPCPLDSRLGATHRAPGSHGPVRRHHRRRLRRTEVESTGGSR
jgi:hypothetical protein